MGRLMDVNGVWFDLSKPNGKKLMMDYINSLLEYNKNSDDQGYVMDIHIKLEEGDCYIVESTQKDFNDHDVGGEFVFKNFDEVICQEIQLPDNTYVLIDANEDPDQYISNWVDEVHPGEYAKNEYGHWYNIEEQKAWSEEISKMEESEISAKKQLKHK